MTGAVAAVATARVLTLADAEAWREAAARAGDPEVVYLPEYAAVFQDYGDGAAECFVYQDPGGLVVYPYIRRPLPADLAGRAPAGACDVSTPYGYGGFVWKAADPGRPEPLLARFRDAFGAAMAERRVVSEFIRFHPLLQNQSTCGDRLPGVQIHKENVFWDLTRPAEVLLQQCRKTYRHEIQQARAGGLVLVQEERPEAIDDFAAMYADTMARHGQRGYLNFPLRFFRCLPRHLGGRVVLFAVREGGRSIASALFLVWKDYIDYFLAASCDDARVLHPNHLLLYEVALWAKARGITTMHLGGGSGPLVFFKGGFSRERRPYHLGRHVHDPGTYAALAEERRRLAGIPAGEPISYFPAYRFGTE